MEHQENIKEISEQELKIASNNWLQIQKPKSLQIASNSLNQSYGKFIVEHLEPGYGITIGHALRRILLSSIQGSSIFAVNIEDVNHEFSTIPGIREDVVEIILNLKELNLKQFTEGVVELELLGEGPATLTGKDISTFNKAEVLNPDAPIVTLEENANISMTLYIRHNKGYITSEENQEYELPLGVIFLDSNHSPIKRINYEIVNTRVGQRTDYDKLIFEIWTNGSVAPEDALAYAAKILKEHMDIFVNFDESLVQVEQQEEQEEVPQFTENLYRSVSDLELSVRSINCLQNAKIETIGDLVQKTESEMLKTKNFGRKSLNEIKTILVGMDLHLGMKLENFDPTNNPYEKNKMNSF